MAQFKVYINAVRANANMNADEFANTIGIDKSTLWRWEHGKGGKPTIDQVRKMSEISGIPMDYIFLRDDATMSH